MELVREGRDNAFSKGVKVGCDCSVVELETTEECLLGEITNLDVSDGKLYILSNSVLYVFDEKGQFLKKTRKGHGPGEFNNALNFSLDSRCNEIVVIESGNLLHLYDLDLNYKNTIKFTGSFIDAYRVDDNEFLLHTLLPGKYEKYMVSLYDIRKDSIMHKLISNEDNPLRNLALMTWNNFIKMNNDIYCYSSNSRKIYKYVDGTMVESKSLDFKNQEPPVSYSNGFDNPWKFKIQAYEDNYIAFLHSYFMFNDFDLLGIEYQGYNCGISYKDQPDKIYLSTTSQLFDLPETQSFKRPINVINQNAYFAYYNDVLLEDESNTGTSTVEIGGQVVEIEENNNPLIVVVNVK